MENISKILGFQSGHDVSYCILENGIPTIHEELERFTREKHALGNRSILADPRSDKMKNIINKKIKHRQWYRPFAPSIIREEVKNWFTRDEDSPYMSMVLKWKKQKTSQIPAVNHFDNSARLQTVTENDNSWYYSFLKKWETKNVPILLNTSFNDSEPIVETPEHAINCFLKIEIDYLYFIETNTLVRKN